jgi:hypothetical protein
MLKVAFGEQTVGRTQVFEWLSKFEVSVASVEEVECLGVHWWAKHENVDWVMTVAPENRWVAVCEVAKMLCISLGLVFWKTVWTCIGLLPNSCSTPAHSALSLCEFLAKNIMYIVPHPPFWVDLVLYTTSLFFLISIFEGCYHDFGKIMGCIFWISNHTYQNALNGDTLAGFAI